MYMENCIRGTQWLSLIYFLEQLQLNVRSSLETTFESSSTNIMFVSIQRVIQWLCNLPFTIAVLVLNTVLFQKCT